MSDTSTDTGVSTPGTTIEDATNAFAALLSGEESGSQKDSEALPEQGDEPTVDAEGEEPDAELEAGSDDDEEPEEAAPAPVYTVKVDGEEIQVPIDELLNGYSRTQDYTRKTQKLAEERKAALAEVEQVRQERAQYSQLLERMKQQIEATSPSEPDWDRLRSEDPIEFGVQWAEHQRRQMKLQAVQAEQGRLAEIQQREQLANYQKAVDREKQLLVQVIPEWQNPEKAKAEKAEIMEFGKRVGFSEDELKNITDHRAVVALRKAYLYDKLMANKAQVKPVQKSAAPVMRPGSASAAPKPQSELTRAKQRLAKTGSLQDAAAAFELLLR